MFGINQRHTMRVLLRPVLQQNPNLAIPVIRFAGRERLRADRNVVEAFGGVRRTCLNKEEEKRQQTKKKNPNGIPSHSPGLRGTSCPASNAESKFNPNGVV